MITNNPAPSFCGERQLANNEKLSSVGAGFALMGRSANGQGRTLAPISRRMAAQPSADNVGPMDPNPVVVTVFPSEGYRYENS